MTVIEIRPHRWGWKALNLPMSSLCFRRKIRQSTTRRTGRAFDQAKFASWIQLAMSNARFRSAKQTESCITISSCQDVEILALIQKSESGVRERKAFSRRFFPPFRPVQSRDQPPRERREIPMNPMIRPNGPCAVNAAHDRVLLALGGARSRKYSATTLMAQVKRRTLLDRLSG
jgi:hypothetical protein